MPKLIDLTGQKYDLLTVIKRADVAGKRVFWKCKCKCGNKNFNVRSDHLMTGHTQSCGCLGAKRLEEGRYKHGASARTNRHTLYSIWSNIVQRCRNPKNKRYNDYGGRGIRLHKQWYKYENFRDYVITLKNCPIDAETKTTGLKRQIDRINNDKGYKPGNVKWSTIKQQSFNKRNSIRVFIINKYMSLIEAVELYSELPYTIVASRVKNGWKVQDALFTPIRNKK